MTSPISPASPARAASNFGPARRIAAVVAVWAVAVAGLAAPAIAQSEQPPAPEPAPAGELAAPDASCVSGPGSISVTWGSVTGATGYRAAVQDFYTGQVIAESPRLTGTSHTFSGLALEPLGYMVWVSALDQDQERSSLLKCAVTEAAGASGVPCPPGQVCGASTASVTCAQGDESTKKTELDVSWDAAAGATNYRVERYQTPILSTDVPQKLETINTTATSHKFTRLVQSRAYDFEVYATVGGQTTKYAEGRCRTYVLRKPTGLLCKTVTHNSITFRWDPVDGAQSYAGKIQLNRTGSEQTDIPTPTTITLPGGKKRITSTITHNQGARLTENTTYYIGVLAVLNGIPQHWSGKTCKTTCITCVHPLPPLPVAPAGLECSDESSSSVTLGWDAVSGASRYRVRKGTGQWSVKASGAARSHEFSGLSANTAYSLSVAAQNSRGWGTAASKECRTLAGPLAGFACSAATSTTLTVAWSEVDGATDYRVSVNSAESWTEKDDGEARSHEFPNLSANTSYVLRGQAQNSTGWGDSARVSCKTLLAKPAVECSAATTSGFTASWDAVSGAEKYRVRIGGGEWDDATGTSHGFPELGAGAEHAVEVQAGDSDGWGDTGSASCWTLPVVPGGLACSGPFAFSFTVSWDEVDGASGYEFRLGGGKWVSVSGTRYTPTGVPAGAQHPVEVRATNSGGHGAAASVSCWTKALSPAADCAAGSSALLLSWNPVAGASGYRVRVGARQWAATAHTAIVVDGLAANSEQWVNVQAQNPAGWSDGGLFSCATRPAAPAVSCSASSTAIDLSWSPQGGATGYRVGADGWRTLAERAEASEQLGGDGLLVLNQHFSARAVHISADGRPTGVSQPEPKGQWAQAAGTAHQLTSLVSARVYWVYAQSRNADGWGDTLMVLCPTQVAPPQNPECAAASNTTTKVSWDPVTSADKYRVAQQPEPGDTENTDDTSDTDPGDTENTGDTGDSDNSGSEPEWAETTQTSHTLDGLAEGTAYLVQAGNEHGWSDTATCTFTVDPQPAQPPPTASQSHGP
ncbi:fibronectin type III domain-containing protein [Candidatus Poriferisocius sp.]|uniref:fibronectin type III domain-containing protein n=1 Tax=Candidatus Poriferisocius sp. TaxID=3101276 RepID=UPI003B02A721